MLETLPEAAQENLPPLTEKDLDYLLAKLPKDLQTRWSAEIDNLELSEAIAFVQGLLTQREMAKERIFTEIHSIESEEIKKEVRSVISTIENTFGDKTYYVGEGTMAEVYSMPYAPHICVKYIKEKNMLEKHGNTARQEVQYLVDLEDFSVEGIRVPKVYFQRMSDNLLCFGMEKIEGMSLDQIINDPSSCEFIEKIQEQNMQDVLRKMKAFIQKLHEEKKIVHRDLATRNIMIDRNGKWYVIDFGKAKRIEIGDSSTDVSETTDFPTAENSIRKLFMKIN